MAKTGASKIRVATLAGRTMMTFAVLTLLWVAGCAGSREVGDYTPVAAREWETSTPEAEGFDRAALDRLYQQAASEPAIYSLLFVKNGRLIAERYFNEGGIDERTLVQSISKSYISALVGIALERGYLTGLDQRLLDFYPEYAEDITDHRKNQITIRQLLQMRSGYPWEEVDKKLWKTFTNDSIDKNSLIVHYPLVASPGTEFHYSNATSWWLADILQRATGTDLQEFAEKYLFDPTGTVMGTFWKHDNGYYHPLFHVSARDAARFGQLYLDGGVYRGRQVVPAEWISESLTSYSSDVSRYYTGKNVNKVGYGYQWWLVRSGDHVYWMALGHGGQAIALLEELNTVIVLTADPQFLEPSGKAWRHEKALRNLLSDFIASLPMDGAPTR